METLPLFTDRLCFRSLALITIGIEGSILAHQVQFTWPHARCYLRRAGWEEA